MSKNKSNEYVLAARRLGNFLETQGMQPRYSQLLEAVAAVHGVKDYNTLTSRVAHQPVAVATCNVALQKTSDTPALTPKQRKGLVDAVTEDYLDTFEDNSEVLEEYIRKGLTGVASYSDAELVRAAQENLSEDLLPSLGIDESLFDELPAAEVLPCEYVSCWDNSGSIVTRGTLNLVTGVAESLEQVELQDEDDICEGEFVRVFGREFALEDGADNAMVLDAEQLAAVTKLVARPAVHEDRTDRLLPYFVQVDDGGDEESLILDFNCMAEDDSHAIEQALDAYPSAKLVPRSVKVDYDVLNVDEDDVAEWVGQHYGHNFDAMSPSSQNEWKLRYWWAQHTR